MSTEKQTGEAIAAMLGRNVERADQADEAEAVSTTVDTEAKPETMPAAEPTDAEFLGALFARQDRKERAQLVSIGLGDSIDQDEDDGGEDVGPDPDFDAGVREPAPLPTDAAADHDSLIAELGQSRPVVRGSSGWRLG